MDETHLRTGRPGDDRAGRNPVPGFVRIIPDAGEGKKLLVLQSDPIRNLNSSLFPPLIIPIRQNQASPVLESVPEGRFFGKGLPSRVDNLETVGEGGDEAPTHETGAVFPSVGDDGDDPFPGGDVVTRQENIHIEIFDSELPVQMSFDFFLRSRDCETAAHMLHLAFIISRIEGEKAPFWKNLF